jgi:hypothetical protein
MKLSTLADVRDLVEKHLPAQYRHKRTWRHVSTGIAKGEKDLLEICVSLRLVLALEAVECLMNDGAPLRRRHGSSTTTARASLSVTATEWRMLYV